MWSERYPGNAAPLEIFQIKDGQSEFEEVLRRRRGALPSPGAIFAYQLQCYLEDVWDYHQWEGRFAIMRCPDGITVADDVELLYVDHMSGEWGPLIPPGSTQWEQPPYGFPALFYVPLSSGAVVWIRLERADELRICYRECLDRSSKNHRFVAFRAAPSRDKACQTPADRGELYSRRDDALLCRWELLPALSAGLTDVL
jgi:hypothetical protein